MNYHLGWREKALAYFEQVIFYAGEIGSAERHASAYAEVKRQLELVPLDVGESRGERERVLIVGDFAVFYDVFEESRTVFVNRVHYRGYPKIDV